MVVIEQLAAQFEIEFVAKCGNAFLDVLRLYSEVLVIVKSVFHNELQIYTFFRNLAK